VRNVILVADPSSPAAEDIARFFSETLSHPRKALRAYFPACRLSIVNPGNVNAAFRRVQGSTANLLSPDEVFMFRLGYF
jgi:hypothetical protein